MSGQICNHCQTENQLGSRFCNNCGQALPPATHLICPNCQTPNPNHLLYCDRCGARLLKGQPITPDEEEDKSASKPPASTARPFALPSRAPGDTGELDLEKLPDWLKTGHTGTPREAGKTAAEDQSVQPDAGLDFLDDWLSELDEIDTSGAGMAEETEFDWLTDRIEEQPTAKTEEEPLPDWLSRVADQQAVSELETEPLPDWLNGEPDDHPTDETEAELLPDWLRGEVDDQPIDEAEVEPLSDWLASELVEEPTVPAEDEPDFDWPGHELAEEPLTEADEEAIFVGLDDSDAEFATPVEPTDDDVDPLAGLTDWLDAALVEELVTESNTVPSDEDDEDGIPDWLATAGTDVLEEDFGHLDWLAEPERPDSHDADEADEADDEMPMAGALPEWLTDLAPRGTGILSLPESGDPETEESGLAEGLDWLQLDSAEEFVELSPETPEQVEPPADAELDAFEFDENFEATMADLPLEIPPDAEDDGLDWLSELALMDDASPDTLGDASPDISDDALLDTLDDAASPAPDELLTSPAAAPDDETPDWLADFVLGEESDAEEVADWFTGTVTEKWPETEPVEADSLAELSTEDEPPTTAQLKGLPPELAAAGLPDWLHDAPGADEADALMEELIAPGSEELPDWLQTSDDLEFDAALDAILPSTPSAPAPPATGMASEWDDVLGTGPFAGDLHDLDDLPPPETVPSVPGVLAAGEIPSWMQALKPRELVEEDEVSEPEEPPLATGPLAGLRGVIGIEPVIAQPHKALLTTPATISAEQQQRAQLLRQLTQQDWPRRTAVGSPRPAPPSIIYRLLLTVLLLTAIIVGLLLPGLGMDLESIQPTDPALSSAAFSLHTAVQDAAGQPILFAFEYSPALAGELDPQATLLLRQVASNGSRVMTVSQSAGGLAKATELTAALPELNSQSLGFLAGEALGLRYLATCFQQNRDCETVNGRELEANLSTVALIVIITGERDNLVNWVEQVGRQVDSPLVVVMTQSLAPVAAPYRATGQLNGALDGLASAAAYEQIRPEGDDSLVQNWQSVALARWLVIVLVLVGNLWYGLTHFADSRRQRRPSA